ncbi:MAG: S8 family peptidase, partial [Bacillota bacterium]|nr:S8 family peptidase [Bacillota bacterium]
MNRQKIIFVVSDASYPSALRSVGIRLCQVKLLSNLDMGIAELTEHQISQLENQRCISCVVRDRRVHALVDKAGTTVGSRIVNKTGLTGRGVTVAIIDTGIARHPDLAGRIVGFKDLVQRSRRPYDNNGHGTHVAGIVAGSGRVSQNRYAGIAPGVKLVGVKVLDRNGSGMLSTVLMGLDWCLANKDRYNIRIVNMSLGAPALTPHAIDPMCRAAQKLSDAGILIIAAAGNSGPAEQSIESPACCPATVAVGAANDRSALTPEACTIASFSSRGPTNDNLMKPDMCAPGVNIVATRARHMYLRKLQKIHLYSYTRMSGTSMAAPVVSGVA